LHRLKALPSRADQRNARMPITLASSRQADGNAVDLQPRRQSVTSNGASVKSMEMEQMRVCMRQMAERLREGGMPLPGLLSLAVSCDSDAGASGSECTASRQCPTELSHATTPSWRSRSFPPNFRQSASPELDPMARASPAVYVDTTTSARRRLPPLPDEAREHKVSPPSEVLRLSDISSEVHEANAMLVESFLNVKRRAMPRPESSCGTACISSCPAPEDTCSGSFRDASIPSSARRPHRRPRGLSPEMGALLEDSESRATSAAA
jgi:hypothetical protein